MIDNADLWAEGKYIDFWTIPHLLTGIILVGLLNWLRIDFWPNFLISSIIIVGWEFFELHILNIHEHLTNTIMDVVTGIFGFLFMYGLIIKYSIDLIIPYLLALIVIYLLLNVWGLFAYYYRVKKIKYEKNSF